MNKKIIAGSIFIIVILVLVSFTSVVSANSSEAKTVFQQMKDRNTKGSLDFPKLLEALFKIILGFIYWIVLNFHS
ncbi:MAG: hypothetical protein NT038_06565 [Euryarchaeota archaeon]|nr:hypothetical protein [Euryarchaeota archaeon]